MKVKLYFLVADFSRNFNSTKTLKMLILITIILLKQRLFTTFLYSKILLD